MVDQYVPKYKWTRTWGDRIDHQSGELLQDFMFEVDGQFAGRIRREEIQPNEYKWAWSGGYMRKIKKPIMPNHGYEKTAREACRRAEEYWQESLDQAKSNAVMTCGIDAA